MAKSLSTVAVALGLLGCGRGESDPHGSLAERGPSPGPSSRPRPSEPAPRTLYLPSEATEGAVREVVVKATVLARVCPPEMVLVDGRYCVDRYEVVLEAGPSGLALSPHYPPTRLGARLRADWVERAPASRGRLGLLPVPELLGESFLISGEPRAVSRPGVVPQGYLSKVQAERVCRNAGKRLCSETEWILACSGERRTQFPYGARYEWRACNVHRTSHPAQLVHGDASQNHLDPRLGLAYDGDGPLLRRAGETATCRSQWGDDAIFDMVGNMDEWVDSPGAAFLGGFFSRATTEGCLSKIATHRADYLDYSLGTRCCRDSGGP